MTNAREATAHLAELLRRERHALADFLLALADFDRDRAWERLGHASLFTFLHRELGLSKGAAFYRKTAVELLQRFPEVVAPLQDGRLCITSVVELAKVLTEENRDEVLPRFFHRSKQEARAISAELRPEAAPARRDVVTAVAAASLPLATSTAPSAPAAVAVQPVEPPHANSLAPSWAAPASAPPRDHVAPMTADLARLHVTVSRRLLAKLEAAKDALAHAKPGATTEEILEAALDLLLAQHAKRRAAQVEKPRPAPTKASADRRHVPASVRREVFTRDGGRCQWKLDSGAICGSAHRLELDHVTPVALGGASTASNLRLLCAAHNRLAARRAFGEAYVETARRAENLRRPRQRTSAPHALPLRDQPSCDGR